MSPCSASDLHSSVHPRVYAFGNQASTIACLFLKSETLYVFPFDACSMKSGAVSPTFSSVAADTCPLDPNATTHLASTVRALIAPPNGDRVPAECPKNMRRRFRDRSRITGGARGRIGPVPC